VRTAASFPITEQRGRTQQKSPQNACKLDFPVRVKLRNTQREQMFSGLPRVTDIVRSVRLVRFVPEADYRHLARPNERSYPSIPIVTNGSIGCENFRPRSWSLAWGMVLAPSKRPARRQGSSRLYADAHWPRRPVSPLVRIGQSQHPHHRHR
jgi:hypothetical protein